MDAWLSFLILDTPEDIISLIEKHPEFKPLYQHIYDMCQNVERMIGMFSEELRILDRNTVRYMVDQMQQELDEKAKTIQIKDEQLQAKDKQLQAKDKRIEELEALIQNT